MAESKQIGYSGTKYSQNPFPALTTKTKNYIFMYKCIRKHKEIVNIIVKSELKLFQWNINYCCDSGVD